MTWAITRKNYSQRRACGLVGLEPKTYRYASKRPGDGEICARLRVLAGERRRFGYRRLHILLSREFGDECLNEYLFSSLAAAPQIIEALRVDYNTERPHTSLDGLTPAVFATRPNQGHTENGPCL